MLLVVIPMGCGLISLPMCKHLRFCRTLGVLSFASTLLLSVFLLVHITLNGGQVLVSQMGAWSAPYGIALVFDSLSGLLLATASAVALGSYVHSFSMLGEATEKRYFHPLIQVLMFGVNLSFLTGDLFNLYVSFELMLLASYALMCLSGSRPQMSQAYKYVLLNLLASTVFVIAAGMAYAMLGTLNMADMARIVQTKLAHGEALPTGFTAIGVMFLFVFGLKGAFFPLWFWLPDTYYTVPISIAGLFGGMLTKVGVYAVARTFPLIFTPPNPGGAPGSAAWFSVGPITTLQPFIAVAAAFTMFLAVLGAVSQHQVRRILSVHVISQVGYMVFGIAVMTGQALAGCVFYMIQHMVVKCSLFLCCGVMEKHTGSDDLDKIGGVLKRDLWLGVLFFVAAMSLVGLPPLSGFFGKMTIIQAGWSDFWWLSVFGLLTGALTLLSMLKIFGYGFWSPEKTVEFNNPEQVKRSNRPAYVGIAMLVVMALFLGFGAELVYKAAFNAGDQLVNPKAYITAVLGKEAYESIGVKAVATEPSSHQATKAEKAVATEPPSHQATKAEVARVASAPDSVASWLGGLVATPQGGRLP